MVNANGREESSADSPSEVEDAEAAQVSMADQDGGHGGEYMGQSPPPSPRASQSPLMFRPQLIPNEVDDLWVIYNLIAQGDREGFERICVRSKGCRKGET